jgi:hypothetical protein
MAWIIIGATLGILIFVAYIFFWWDPYDEEEDDE